MAMTHLLHGMILQVPPKSPIKKIRGKWTRLICWMIFFNCMADHNLNTGRLSPHDKALLKHDTLWQTCIAMEYPHVQ